MRLIFQLREYSVLFAISLAFYLICPTGGALEEPTTQEEIEQAICEGVSWLSSQQMVDGSWGHPSPVAKTSLAVLMLEEITAESDFCEASFGRYFENAQKGLDYIFGRAILVDIDEDGVFDALYFPNYPVYEPSTAIMAIASTNELQRVVEVPGSPVDGWTYEEVGRFALNYLVYAQKNDGGWGHIHGCPTCESDVFNTGYAMMGIAYARDGFGVFLPASVEEGLNRWVDSTSSDERYASGYDAYNEWDEIVGMNSLIFGTALVGDSQELDLIRNAFYDVNIYSKYSTTDSLYRGPVVGGGWKRYQGIYTILKALETTSLDGTGSLYADIYRLSDMSSRIVDAQNEDGSWNSNDPADKILTTEWALLSLKEINRFSNSEREYKLKLNDFQFESPIMRSQFVWSDMNDEFDSHFDFGFEFEDLDLGGSDELG